MRLLPIAGGMLLLGFALQGASCADQLQTGINAGAPAVAAYTTLNDVTLAAVAAANPGNAKLQATVAKLRAGNALVASDAVVLAAELPAVGVMVDSAMLVGKTMGAQVKTKS